MFNFFSRSAVSSMFKVAIFVLSIATPFTASASLLSIDGSTLGDPTWHRLLGENPSDLSDQGTAVAYDVILFQVDTNATYDFLSTATTPLSWDNNLYLYQNSFDPLSQFANFIIGNEDYFDGIDYVTGLSGFSAALSSGINYFVVTSGFYNDDAGDFTLSISSNGGTAFIPDVNDVPEPATLAILGIALLGGGIIRRRKKV